MKEPNNNPFPICLNKYNAGSSTVDVSVFWPLTTTIMLDDKKKEIHSRFCNLLLSAEIIL